MTGGAGFAGRHLAAALVAGGHTAEGHTAEGHAARAPGGHTAGDHAAEGHTAEVRVLDLRPSTVPGTESIVGGVTDLKLVRRACRGVDTVFHLAALLPQRRAPTAEMRRVNVGGAETVLAEAARAGVERVVVLSSTEVYGVPQSDPCGEDAPLAPIGEYGRNKVEVERICREAAAAGMHVAILRPCTIVGAGMPEPAIRALLAALARNLPVAYIGSGRSRFHLLAVSDLVAACLAARDVPAASGQACNLASAGVPTLKETMETLKARTGSRSPVVALPAWLVRAVATAARLAGRPLVEPEHLAIVLRDFYTFDVTKAHALLGWAPTKDNVAALADALPGAAPMAGGAARPSHQR